MESTQSTYYSIKQVADKLDLSERYIKERINEGMLPAIKAFSKWYVGHEDLQRFILTNGIHSHEVLSKR